MGTMELVALLSLSSWCIVTVVLLFFAVPWVCLQFVIVVQRHVLSQLWRPEGEHLCNFGRRHLYYKQFCEIVLNLDKWFRR